MQLILIGGAQRSGTTLLQTLLANAAGSSNLPEAHILSDIFATYKRAKGFGNKTSYFYARDDDLRAFFQSFAERHVADIVAAKPSAVLILKDPNFIQVLDEAADLFPRSVRIVCMRDPRDIAASFVQIGQRQASDTKPGKYERRDINFISKKILTSYLPLMQETKPADVIVVRYEAIASNAKASLAALARDAGLELSLDRIEQPVWLDAEARHEASWITELEGAGASPTSIGSFERVLSGDEVATVQDICKPIMSQFGYAPIETPRRRPGVLGFLKG